MAVTSKTLLQPDFVSELVLSKKVTIDSTAVDAGNSGETHILRPGLVLGVYTAQSTYIQYDDAGGPGVGETVARYILLDEVDLKDGDPGASASDHVANVMVIGRVKESKLHGIDDNGKADLAKGGSGDGFIVFE